MKCAVPDSLKPNFFAYLDEMLIYLLARCPDEKLTDLDKEKFRGLVEECRKHYVMKAVIK